MRFKEISVNGEFDIKGSNTNYTFILTENFLVSLTMNSKVFNALNFYKNESLITE